MTYSYFRCDTLVQPSLSEADSLSLCSWWRWEERSRDRSRRMVTIAIVSATPSIVVAILVNSIIVFVALPFIPLSSIFKVFLLTFLFFSLSSLLLLAFFLLPISLLLTFFLLSVFLPSRSPSPSTLVPCASHARPPKLLLQRLQLPWP